MTQKATKFIHCKNKPVLFDLGILQTVLKLHDRLMHKLTRHKL